MSRTMLTLFLGMFMISNAAADDVYQCVFSKDGWQTNDWFFLKRPDFKTSGKWIQGDDYIQNDNPVYTSMLYKAPMTNDVVIRCTMSFVERMAPAIVIANATSTNESGCIEYTDSFEIVLYDKGINVWHLTWKGDEIDGRKTTWRDHWRKTAFWEFPLVKNQRYTLVVTKQGKDLKVEVDNHTFGYIEDDFRDTFHVGITGCEGINRFYDFSVTVR